MNLKVLGSSSAGNCYLLDNGIECLNIECGVSLKNVDACLDYHTKRICGCLISHEHGDHAKFAEQAIRRCIPVYTSEGTANALGETFTQSPMCHTILPFVSYNIGGFRVIPFPTKHDAAQPFGFFINHPETGNILFATDTYYLPNTFSGLNNVMIECNYALDILDENIDKGLLPRSLRNRIIKSHLSIETCIETLKANDLSGINNIILIHLSSGNSDAERFIREVQDATGKNVTVAHKGMDIQFNKTPF